MPTIINGGSRGNGAWWSKHVQDTEKNARVELIEIVGLSAENIPDAFREMNALARGSKAQNYFYEYDINPSADEKPWTNKQWAEAHALIQRNLGLEGQPYFRVRHTKPDGRIHEHGFAFRIDLDRQTAISDSLTARIHEQTARELEIKFDMQRGRSILVPDRQTPRPERRAKKWERFRGAQTGIDPHDIDRELSAIKARSDNGQSFRAGIEAGAARYLLARGDRRDFMVIDQNGDAHSLARRLHIKAAELRAFMKDVDPATLPTVAQGRIRQEERQAAREFREKQRDGLATVAPRPSHMRAGGPENGRDGHSGGFGAGKRESTISNTRGAWTASKDAGDLVAELAARNIRLAVVSAADASANKEQRAVAKQLGRFAPTLKEGQIVAVDGRGHVYSFAKRTTGSERADIQQRLAGIDPGFLLSVDATQKAHRAASRAAWVKQKRIEWEKARPVSKTAQTILDAAKTAAGDRAKFAAELHKQGVAVVRVTAADVKSLQAARHDDEVDRVIAGTNDALYRQAPRLDNVQEGELAAVLRSGAVIRLNQHHMAGLAAVGIIQPEKAMQMQTPDSSPPPAGEKSRDVGNNPIAAETPLEGAAEARAGFESERFDAAAFQREMIDIQQARGDEAAQARAAGQADRAFDAALSNAAADLADTVEAAIDRGERTAGNFLASAAAWFEGVISGLGNLLASPSKPTELEREVAPKVAAERAQDNADLAAYFDNEAARDRLLGGIRIDDAEQERQSRLEGGRDPDYERDM